VGILGNKLYEKVTETAGFLKERFEGEVPNIAIILGSGLGDVAKALEPIGFIYYRDIPNFPLPTVLGHEGKLWWGKKNGKSFVVLQGRLHFYEGYSMEKITFPVRALAFWGVKLLIITASVGGIADDLEPGDLVLIKDHMNFMGDNPLRGINDPSLGERFPDMTQVYDEGLRSILREKFNLKEGVYVAVCGPSYETPAEIRAFKILGADIVGMSVVPEATVAKQMGLKVLGIAGVANKAAGLGRSGITHEEVLKNMSLCREKLTKVLSFCLEGGMDF